MMNSKSENVWAKMLAIALDILCSSLYADMIILILGRIILNSKKMSVLLFLNPQELSSYVAVVRDNQGRGAVF